MGRFEYRFDCGLVTVKGFPLTTDEVHTVQAALDACRAVYIDENGDVLVKALSERTGVPQERVLEYAWKAYSADGEVGVYVRLVTDGDLTPAEVYDAAREISGQNSDGFGEGVEQRRTYLSDGSYAHIHLGEPFFGRFGTRFPDVEYAALPSEWEKECGWKERLWHIG